MTESTEVVLPAGALETTGTLETTGIICESKRSTNNIITTKMRISKDIKKRLRDEHIIDATTGTVINIRESKRNYSIDIIAPYIDDTLIDKYYRLQCIHDKTIPATIFGRSNPTKEITESMADGVAPKTGSIFAISTKWDVY